jgi:hypothetical protein
MTVALPVHRIPSGLLAAAGGQTACPSDQTTPGTEANGSIVRPGGQTAPGTNAGSPTVPPPGGQTAHETEAGGPTAVPDGQIVWPAAATSSPALLTSAAPRMTPTTSVVPHAAPMLPTTPCVAHHP